MVDWLQKRSATSETKLSFVDSATSDRLLNQSKHVLADGSRVRVYCLRSDFYNAQLRSKVRKTLDTTERDDPSWISELVADLLIRSYVRDYMASVPLSIDCVGLAALAEVGS